MKALVRSASLAAALGAAALCGCKGDESAPPGGGASPPRPHIVLISIDTLRADRLGCYGHPAARTPVLDALAAQGVAFDRAYTTAPITLPAHVSMLTGQIPPRHGVRDNGSFRLAESARTLAEALGAIGYRTGAFIGGLPLARTTGLAQGFDTYDDDLSDRSLDDNRIAFRSERYAEEVLDLASSWLRQSGATQPAFAFIHLYDPHSPYVKALPGSGEPSYDGEIAHVDREIGRFLETLDGDPAWRRRLLVVTADHGEGLGEHGEQTHCVFVYDSTLRIPLVFHWPDALAPRRVAVPASLVDLAPTLLALAGAAPLAEADGRSLQAELSGSSEATERELYFESLFGQLRFGWAPLRGVRRASWKLIEAPRAELYELSADPGERDNRLPAAPDEARALRASLAAIGDGASNRVVLDDETAERLASLGYVSAAPAAAAAAAGAQAAEAPDPKDQIDVYERFQRAHAELLAGRLGEALALMAALEPSLSRSPYFYVEWGNFAAAAEQWPLAAASYRKCLALEAANEDALLNLGVALMKTGAAAEAGQQFTTLLSIDPNHAKAHLYGGLIRYQHFRDAAGARAHWIRFLELAPADPQAAEIRRVMATLPAT